MTGRRRSHYPWGVRVDRLNALVAILIGLVIVLAAADADAQRRRRRRRRQRRQVPTTGQLVILTPQPLHGAEVLIDGRWISVDPTAPWLGTGVDHLLLGVSENGAIPFVYWAPPKIERARR